MGCSASKDIGQTMRESWYAPLPRSISAPIRGWLSVTPESYHDTSTGSKESVRLLGKHRPSITASDHALTSQKLSDYHVGEGLNALNTKTLKPGLIGCHKPQLRHLLEEEDEGTEHMNNQQTLQHQDNDDANTTNGASGISSMQHSLSVSSLNLMVDVPEHAIDGFDDGSHADFCDNLVTSASCETTHDSVIVPAEKTPFSWGQSLSFNAVHALDTCFNEVGSPKWQRRTKVEGSTTPPENSYTISTHDVLPQDYEHTSYTASPMLNSSLEGSCSPLFDPAVLAAFEEAVDNSRPHDGDWTLIDHVSNDSSSLSSYDRFVWVSSGSEETSDAESVDYFPSSAQSVDHVPANVLQYGMDNTYLGHMEDDSSFLERFELKCPPRGENKVVLYFTSLRGIRKTYNDCHALRLILEGFGVDVDERDVWMHYKFREELSDLLGPQRLTVPRLFIKGRYIGGADEVKQLNEDGVLVELLKDLPTFGKYRKACETCGDAKFIPCINCSGSCKIVNEEDHTIRCPMCNENGLMMCPMCCSWQVSQLQTVNKLMEEPISRIYSPVPNILCPLH